MEKQREISVKGSANGATRPICRYATSAQGCPLGEMCRFRHDDSDSAVPSREYSVKPAVCRYGSQCRDRETCRFRHEEAVKDSVPAPTTEAVTKTTAQAPSRGARAEMSCHYSIEELKSLGFSCSKRLPPASAVQAMFLYEMQRQSEVEHLFQAQMFGMARADETTNSTSIRIAKLEAELRKTQQKVDVKEVQERLETSKIRFQTQQAKIDDTTTKMKEHGERHQSLAASVEEIRAANAAGIKTTAIETALAESLAGLKADIADLEGEQDALIAVLKESNDKIARLEDLVRELSGQIADMSRSASSSPVQVHRLPMRTTNGQSLELAVPRGTGLYHSRENRVPVRQ
ncbi:hypothetical protein LTR10_003994 [Elasticomyces elasticus]|nr:hypothetical protein LTR10_003994 [Elasticomyces elasticus]KAK4977818.1 hypothetical protein LTR42_002193 [Elasticomyces elasticus]